MWTSYFVVLVVLLLIFSAMLYVCHLFGSRTEARRLLWWVASVSAAAAYCGWRAFW